MDNDAVEKLIGGIREEGRLKPNVCAKCQTLATAAEQQRWAGLSPTLGRTPRYREQAERIVEFGDEREDGSMSLRINGRALNPPIVVSEYLLRCLGVWGSPGTYAIRREPEPEQSKDSGVSEMVEHSAEARSMKTPQERITGLEHAVVHYRSRADAAEAQLKQEHEGERVVEVQEKGGDWVLSGDGCSMRVDSHAAGHIFGISQAGKYTIGARRLDDAWRDCRFAGKLIPREPQLEAGLIREDEKTIPLRSCSARGQDDDLAGIPTCASCPIPTEAQRGAERVVEAYEEAEYPYGWVLPVPNSGRWIVRREAEPEKPKVRHAWRFRGTHPHEPTVAEWIGCSCGWLNLPAAKKCAGCGSRMEPRDLPEATDG